MRLDLKRVAEFIRRAETEELLDRVTVYREGMEPAALDLMEGELDRRGITREMIADHDEERRQDGDHASGRNCHAVQLLLPPRGRGDPGLAPALRPGADLPAALAYCAVHQKQKPHALTRRTSGVTRRAGCHSLADDFGLGVSLTS